MKDNIPARTPTPGGLAAKALFPAGAILTFFPAPFTPDPVEVVFVVPLTTFLTGLAWAVLDPTCFFVTP